MFLFLFLLSMLHGCHTPPTKDPLPPPPFPADVAEPTFAEVFYDYEGWSKGCGVVEFRTGPLQKGVEGPSDSYRHKKIMSRIWWKRLR